MRRFIFLLFAASLAFPAVVFAQEGDESSQKGNVRLTKPPKLVEQVQAEYTEEAVENRIEGGVKLRLLITATGNVGKVEVLEGLGYGLDKAAVEAAKQFKFEPAEINNQPAPVTLDFTINFSLPTMPATFRGQVVDLDDGQPLENVVVGIKYVGDEYDPAPEARMVTEADGEFSFREVPPGPYKVELQVEGYQDRAEQVELGSGETVEVTYKFSKSPINLRGEVLEAGTRKPLAGVEVRVLDPESGEELRQNFTDSQARFAFRGLQPGSYRLVFEADAYESYSSVEQVKEGEITEGTFYLRKEYYDEYSVKTTVRREQREVSRKRIELQELRRVPGTGGDVVRVVQNMPGVARPSYVSGQLVVRGAAPEDTKVFLQGDTIPLVFHFLGGPAVVSSEMLDAVDFYPGNFSAYYGRATGGVVALRTRSPREDRFHGFAEVDLIDATAQFEGPISEDVSFALSARRSYIDAVLPVLAPDELTDQVTVSPRYYDYQGWLTWRASDEHKVELFLYGSDDEIATVFDDEDDPRGNTNVQIDGASFGQLFHRGQIRWEWRPAGEPIETDFSASFGLNSVGFDVADNLFLNIDYYQTQIRQDIRIKAAEQLQLRMGADLQLGTAAYELQLPRTDDDRGGDFDGDGNGSINLSPSGVVADEAVPIMQPAFYAEAEYKPIEELKIIPGMRLDYDGQIAQASFSPRLTSRYKVLDNLVAKGGVGLFTQPPLPNESGTVFGTPDLDFEKAMHYAAGAEWRILDYLELDGTLFYRDMFDLIEVSSAITVDDSGQGEDVRYTNLGEGRAYGMELLLRHYPQNRFFGWVSYTLSRAERQDPVTKEYSPFRFDQTHILTAVAGYNLPYDIDVSTRFRLVTGNPYTPVVDSVWDADEDDFDPVYGDRLSARTDTFHQLDVRIDKKFIYDTFIIGAYLEVINAYNATNAEGRDYNYDHSESAPVPGLPIIPTLGVNGRF